MDEVLQRRWTFLEHLLRRIAEDDLHLAVDIHDATQLQVIQVENIRDGIGNLGAEALALLECGLRPFAVRQVAVDALKAHRLPLGIPHDPGAHLHRYEAPILAHQLRFEGGGVRSLTGQILARPGFRQRDRGGRGDFPDMLAHQVRHRPAEEPLGAAVGIGNDAIEPHDSDRIIGVFHQRAVVIDRQGRLGLWRRAVRHVLLLLPPHQAVGERLAVFLS